MCKCRFVCTLVNAVVLQRKTPPEQVAAGDDNMRAIGVFNLH